ncbi:50S ribosomal protein L18 [Kiritimatiellota bacterium B12222]|nr:50S ribosomal protein L18 [Kiritimatiellota bacterium B12222]
MMSWKTKSEKRVRRHLRVRNKVAGTAACPRMSVYRSNKNLAVQFIDDEAQVTLAAVSTQQAEFKDLSNTVSTATAVGQKAAEVAKAAGIETVVFDRGGFRYAGRVAALATAAREGGLKF